MQCTRVAPAARIAGVVMALGLTLLPAATAAAHGREPSAAKRWLTPSASWHGRPIQEPHRHTAVLTSSVERPLRGWSAGPVAQGVGYHRPSGSERVREVQRRLRALGYRPGPIDGIFGPRTRAAVGWFQVKHGFDVNGRATLAMVRHLRARTTPGGPDGRRLVKNPERSGVPEPEPWEAFRELVNRTPAGIGAAREETPQWWIACLALLGAAIALGGLALVRRSAVTVGRPVRALGYIRVAPQQRDGARFQAQAAAIEERCADRGMALTGLIVEDDDGDERAGRPRPGLAFALDQLESGEADCLVVAPDTMERSGRWIGRGARTPATRGGQDG